MVTQTCSKKPKGSPKQYSEMMSEVKQLYADVRSKAVSFSVPKIPVRIVFRTLPYCMGPLRGYGITD